MNRVETAKCFMFVCVGLLALAGVFELMTSSAVAQSPDPTSVAAYQRSASGGQHYVIMANGDFYLTTTGNAETWQYVANIFTSAGVVPSSEADFGDLKSQFR